MQATTRPRRGASIEPGLPARLLACAVLSTTGCGSSMGDSQAAGADARADAANVNGGQCCSTPTRLVEGGEKYYPEPASVQIPTLGVNSKYLFMLTNIIAGMRTSADGYLTKVPLRGGAPEVVASIPGPVGGAQGLVVTPDAAIVGTSSPDGGETGAIMRFSAESGEATTLAPTNGLVDALAADDENVYFVDAEGTKSVPLTGGPVRIVATRIATSLSVAGGRLFLAEFSAGIVSSVSVDGGDVTILAQNQPAPLRPIECGSDVCWLVAGESFNGMLMRLGNDGGAPVPLAEGMPEPLALVFDEKYFFITRGFGSSVIRVPAGGGPPMDIIFGGLIAGLALDDTCLYWSGMDGVYSIARTAADGIVSDAGG